MGSRGQEQQTRRLVRMADAEGCSDRAAEGMADDNSLLDAALFHQFGNGIGLA